MVGDPSTVEPRRLFTKSAQIATLDTFNPQIAARLVAPLLRWPRYDQQCSEAMKLALEELLSAAGILSDLFEMVSKELKQGERGFLLALNNSSNNLALMI